MVFIDDIDFLNSINKEPVEHFPLQVFQDYNGKIKLLISLMPNQILNKNLERFKVDKFEILNNFNIFNYNKSNKSSIIPVQSPIFESYVQYFNEIKNNVVNGMFSKNTYEMKLNFTKDKSKEKNLDFLNSKIIINEYNLRYNSQLSKFVNNFYQNDNKQMKRLFKTRATFPDFNSRNNYLLIIKKKNNTIFKTFLSFLKNWTYQTIEYELMDRIILYGFLLPKFEISEELLHLNELFEKYDIEFKFEIINNDLHQSNLSIYYLPLSNQFSNESFSWNLEKKKINLSIKEKEEIISSTLNQEKKLVQS